MDPFGLNGLDICEFGAVGYMAIRFGHTKQNSLANIIEVLMKIGTRSLDNSP